MELCSLNSDYYSDDDFSDVEFSIRFSLVLNLTDKILYATVLSPMKRIFDKNLNITAKSERNQSTEVEHDFMYFQQNSVMNVLCKSQIISEMLAMKNCTAFQPM